MSYTTSFNISNYDKGPGILFENHGNVKVAKEYWNIVFKFDIFKFDNHISLIKRYCKLMDEKSAKQECNSIKTIVNNWNIAFHQFVPENAKNETFVKIQGVANDEFETLIKDILIKNEVRNDSDIITANLFEKLTKFNENLNITRINEELNCLIDQLNHDGENLIKSLVFPKSFFFDFNIISAKQYITSLKDLKLMTPKNLKYPLEMEEKNIQQILSVSKLLIFSYGTTLYYWFRNPLCYENDFQLLQPLPLPLRQNEMFMFIQPTTEYLLISKIYDKYAMISKNSDCIYLRDDRKYICQPLDIKSTKYSKMCEINLLWLNKISPTCSVGTIRINEPIIKNLYKSNLYIIITTKATLVTYYCTKTVSIWFVNGTNIIRLDKDCSLEGLPISIQTSIQHHNLLPLIPNVSMEISENSTLCVTTLSPEFEIIVVILILLIFITLWLIYKFILKCRK